MRPDSLDAEILNRLAWTPLLDRQEMVAVTGRSRSAFYEAVRRLEESGLVASLPHAADLIPTTRRYFLTAQGLQRLAENEGVTVESLLGSRPVSARWRRLLMERLDAIATVYRLASTVADVIRPVRLRLYRAGPLDAALMLPDRSVVGVVRQGRSAERSAFSQRLWKLGQGQLPAAVLVLMADEVRLRHARTVLRRTQVNAFLALERDAALAGPDARVWRAPSGNADLDLRYLLDRSPAGGELPREEPPASPTVPGDIAPGADHALPTILKPAEKCALDLLADWPWMLQRDLAGLMGVSETRVSHITTPLEKFGLIARVPAAKGRLALADRGLAVLAHRDRASLGAARRRWSVSPIDPDGPDEWRNISGGRSRQLLRNIDHTAAVHAFVSTLAEQCRDLGWEMAQIDPPHRASRSFRHEDTQRAVNPDAFGVLSRGPVTWPFFLEWERRAVRPATMSERLAPYLRYYSSHRPTDDHGVRPHVLIVFEDDIAAINFLRVAREDLASARVEVPLWVSHKDAIDALGPLGRAWRTPGDWEPAHLLQNAPRTGYRGR